MYQEGLEAFIRDELAVYLDALEIFADPCTIELFPTGAYRLIPTEWAEGGYPGMPGVALSIVIPSEPLPTVCAAALYLRAELLRLLQERNTQ